jgi:hypothetical protein
MESVQAGITKLTEQIKTEGVTDKSGKYLLEPEEVAPAIPTQTTTYEPPPATATTVVDNYSKALLLQEQKTRETLEKKYQAEIDRINLEKETAQKRADKLTTKTEGIITDKVEPLLEPFRAELETSERERLKVEENYFENQALVDELDTLLTQIQTDIQATKDITGLASIREPRISKATENATARVGVIEAVMAARNNQISQAYTLIDRTTEAITADRQDQLTYYSTLIDFYDKQRDEEGNKILTLENDQKTYIAAQVGLLENDLAQAQTNSNYIKSLMTNPDTAQFMASAGIMLNDTPEEVNTKMAEQSEREQVADFTNDLKSKGYEYVPYTTNTAGLVSYEVGGQTLWFKPPAEEDGEIYTEKNIPPTLIQDVIDTLTDKEGAKSLGRELSLIDMIKLFPNVDRELLQDYMDEFYDYEQLQEDIEMEEKVSPENEENVGKFGYNKYGEKSWFNFWDWE